MIMTISRNFTKERIDNGETYFSACGDLFWSSDHERVDVEELMKLTVERDYYGVTAERRVEAPEGFEGN